MPDRPPENPAQPEHIRRSGTASSIFQPKAMPSKSGRSVRRPSLRRREGCRRPRPKRTAYHPPEARREAPCPPPHSRPAAKKRRTEEVVGSAEASYIPAGGRTAHSSGHRIGGRSPAGARPPRGRETSAPTSDPEYRLRDDTRRPTGRVLHNPEISPFLYSGIGFVPFRSRRGAASERSYLRKRLSRERVPVRRPLPPDCLVHRPGTDTSQRAGLRRGGDFRSRPHRTGRQFRRFVPGRPSCTALAGGADTSVGERHLPRHNGRSIRLIAEHGLSTTGKRRPPVLRPERTKDVDPRRGHCPTRHGFDQKRRTPAVVSVRPAVRAPFQTERKKQIEAARSVSSTAVEVPSEHAYSAASCNLEWQTTKTRQANESFAAASGEPLIRGKYENCND